MHSSKKPSIDGSFLSSCTFYTPQTARAQKVQLAKNDTSVVALLSLAKNIHIFYTKMGLNE